MKFTCPWEVGAICHKEIVVLLFKYIEPLKPLQIFIARFSATVVLGWVKIEEKKCILDQKWRIFKKRHPVGAKYMTLETWQQCVLKRHRKVSEQHYWSLKIVFDYWTFCQKWRNTPTKVRGDPSVNLLKLVPAIKVLFSNQGDPSLPLAHHCEWIQQRLHLLPET